MITEDEWRKAAEALWQIATSGTKLDWGCCPGCNKKVQLDRPDLRARADALRSLQEMGFGKPKAEDEGRAGFILKRVIVNPPMGALMERRL